MTSLASQLQHLRVKAPCAQTSLGSDLVRPSIWREPGEAAKYDRESVYELGVSGLDELQTIDDCFVQYEETLFGRSSVTLERTTQTKEVNDQLDQTISEFLIHLSPYLLMNASRKALEWLIYRFHIHQLNVDDLIMCVMPYHDTSLFVSVIKLIKLDDPTNKWNWLHSSAKAGVPIARVVFINHCRKDPGFLSFICNMVPRYIEVVGTEAPQVRLAVNIFTIVSLGVLDNRSDITERVVSILVPHFERGLRSRCIDLKAATYVTLGQLSVKVNLDSRIVASLVDKLVKHISGRLVKEGLCCLVIIMHHQKLESLSKKSFRILCRLPGILQLLLSLSASFNISGLVNALLDELITTSIRRGPSGSGDVSMIDDSSDVGEGGEPQYFQLLLGLLESVSMSEDRMSAIVTSVLSELLQQRRSIGVLDNRDNQASASSHQKLNNWSCAARPLLSIMDRKMCPALETAFESLQRAAAVKENEHDLDFLHELSTLTSMPVRYQLVPDLETNLLLGIGHAKASNRFLAVKYLVKRINDGSALQDLAPEFISDKLLERLLDDDISNVRAVLGLQQKLVEVVIDKAELGSRLLTVVEKIHGQIDVMDVIQKSLELLCSTPLRPHVLDLELKLAPWLLVGGDIACNIIPASIIVNLLTRPEDQLTTRPHSLLCCLSDRHMNLISDIKKCLSSSKKLKELKRLGAQYDLALIADLSVTLVAMTTTNYRHTIEVLLSCSKNSMQTRFLLIAMLSHAIKSLRSAKQGGTGEVEVGNDGMDKEEVNNEGASTAEDGTRKKQANLSRRKEMKRRIVAGEASDKGVQNERVEAMVTVINERLMMMACDLLLTIEQKNQSLQMGSAQDVQGASDDLDGSDCKKFSNLASKEDVTDWLKCLKNSQRQLPLPIAFIIWSLIKTTTALKICQISDVWTSSEDIFARSVLKMISIVNQLFGLKKKWKKLFLKDIIRSLDRTSFLKILCLVWRNDLSSVDNSATVDPVLLDSFKIAQRLCDIKSNNESNDMTTFLSSEVWLCLLLSLTSSRSESRRGSLNVLSAIKQSVTATTSFIHLKLLSKLTRRSEEIIADRQHVYKIVGDVYSAISSAETSQSASFSNLFNHMSNPETPDLIRLALIDLVAQVPHKLVMLDLIQLGDKLISTSQPLSSYDLDIIERVLARFDVQAAPMLQQVSCPQVEFLIKVLRTRTMTTSDEIERTAQTLAVNQISREFFGALPLVDVQRSLVSALVDAYVTTVSTTLALAIKTCFKRLNLSYVHIMQEIKVDNEDNTTAIIGKTAAARQKKPTRVMKNKVPIDIKRLSLILEVIQSRKKFSDCTDMVAALFRVLSRLVIEDNTEETDYLKHLTLTALFNICTNWMTSKSVQDKQPEILNIDALVECIRSSTSTQSQRQALLVVTAIAPHFPEYILHNMMSVFTFMGTTLVQRDDAYSFHVIMKTIDAVIPAIIQAQTKDKSRGASKLASLVNDVLRVFVDARHHIPRHRCIPLYRHLIETIGLQNNLWRFYVLVIEAAIRSKSVLINIGAAAQDADLRAELTDEKQSALVRDMDIVVNISTEFSVEVQLGAVVQIIVFLQQLLSVHTQGKAVTSIHDVDSDDEDADGDAYSDKTPSRATGGKRPAVRSTPIAKDMSKKPRCEESSVVSENLLSLITLKTLTAQQLRLIQYHTSRLVTAILANQKLVADVLNETKTTEEMKSRTGDVIHGHADLFRRLVDETLCYMTRVARVHGKHSIAATTAGPGVTTVGAGAATAGSEASAASSTLVAKFWKSLLQKVYEILDKVNYLLPNTYFLDVIASLMCHQSMSVRRKALDLLSAKLQRLEFSHLSSVETENLIGLVSKLSTVAVVDESGQEDADFVSNRQMSVYCIKLLCRLLGQHHPNVFTPIFPVAVDILTSPKSALALRYNALLCITELCSTLKAHAIQYLPMFMSPLITLLNDDSFLQSGELALVCSLTAVQKIVSSLPHFLSPYLVDLLLCVCSLSCGGLSNSKQAADKLSVVCNQLSTSISARVFIPEVANTYSKLAETNQHGIAPLISLLRKHVELMTKEDLTAQQSALTQIFFQGLNIRNSAFKLSWTEMDNCEDIIIECIIANVVRLSESAFRPMFYKLYDWSCREDDAIYRNRKLTFFRLADRLAARLKSVFTLFVGHIVRAACHMLEINNDSHGEVVCFINEGIEQTASRKSCLIIDHVLGCLQKCLLYDAGHSFVNTYTASIMQPIIDQLENFIGGYDAYQTRISDYVVPCLGQLAVAARETSAWKSLNYQVCLKTRHTSPRVRFATLRAIEGIAKKLGDGYEALLPETMPFLAELLEDDSEEVEQECQRVKGCLEELLGESLGKYF